MAIIGMILGFLSCFTVLNILIGGPIAILAIIFSSSALYSIKKNKKQGKGMAIAGLITGITTILLIILARYL